VRRSPSGQGAMDYWRACVYRLPTPDYDVLKAVNVVNHPSVDRSHHDKPGLTRVQLGILRLSGPHDQEIRRVGGQQGR